MPFLTKSIMEARLQAANDAYRNGRPLLMTDEEYDAGILTLPPDHPLRTKVRAPPEHGKVVKMPYYLGSLDKVKTKEEWVRWRTKHTGEVVLSEKLDGISAMYHARNQCLYLSGDDWCGVDVSAWIPHLQWKSMPRTSDYWVRGELILPTASVPPGRLGRSIVNGLFHQLQPDPVALASVRFVAFEIVPSLDPVDIQFQRLMDANHHVPWVHTVHGDVDAAQLDEFLATRRKISEYDMDGIVVKMRQPQERVVKGNPKDAVAWKPPTGESKLTRIVAIEWNPSANGRLTPRIQVEPTILGGSTIQFVTGVHARRVLDWGIGVGAMVVLRKGGDVIPGIDAVEVRADVTFPPDGTWVWDGDEETALYIRQVEMNNATIHAQWMKLITQLKWDGIGPAVVTTMLDHAYRTVSEWRAVAVDELICLLGNVKGRLLYDLVQTKGWANKTETDLYLSYPQRMDGIGKTKLDALKAVCPDYRDWATTDVVVKGWSVESLRTFQANWREYESFRTTEWNFLPYPTTAPAAAIQAETVKPGGCWFVMSGTRDPRVSMRLIQQHGWVQQETLTNKTNVLIIPDDPGYTSNKVTKARSNGCEILRLQDVYDQYF